MTHYQLLRLGNPYTVMQCQNITHQEWYWKVSFG